MTIRFDKFSGEVPKLNPRLLPQNTAQIAQNVRLDDGALTPFRCGKLAHTFGSSMQTIYRHNGTWLGWPEVVKVVPGPIADDRLYITGDGAPKLRVGGVTYPLAVERPTATPNASASGVVNPALAATYVYSYTVLTSLDEESEPSPISNPVVWSPGVVITLTNLVSTSTSRAALKRIYRSQTSALGETTMFLVAEIAFAATSFVDNVTSSTIQEPLPSLFYNAPPDDLQGITALPNGIMAAFVGKKLYFSEPYKPHAWPERYVLTTEFDIVGLGAFGQSVAVVTKGHPYVVSGITPDAMSMDRIRVNLACTSASGIVDLGYAVVYPSDQGLVAISSGGAEVMTGNLIGIDAWRRLGAASMIAGHTNGRYAGTYTAGGYAGMLIVDTTGAQPFLIRSSDSAAAMWNEPGTGRLFMLSGNQVFEWDSPDSPYGQMLWRSKENVLPGYTNYGALLVEGVDTMTPEEREANRTAWDKETLAANVVAQGAPPFWLEPIASGLLSPSPPPTPGFCVAIYADGALVHIVTDMNKPARLPAGFLALSWEVEVYSTLRITAISLAPSPSDLAVI